MMGTWFFLLSWRRFSYISEALTINIQQHYQANKYYNEKYYENDPALNSVINDYQILITNMKHECTPISMGNWYFKITATFYLIQVITRVFIWNLTTKKFFSNQVLLVCCKFIKHVTLNLTIKFNYFAKLTENEGLRQTWKNCPGDPWIKELITYQLYHKNHGAHMNLHHNDEGFWWLHPRKIILLNNVSLAQLKNNN